LNRSQRGHDQYVRLKSVFVVVFVKFDAVAVRSFCLRWIVRPLVFALPFPLVAWWCDVSPGWNMAALTFFCIFWADTTHLFGRQQDAAAEPIARDRRGPTARRWYDWDFTAFEAAMAASLRVTGRTIAFALPALIVAHWCGMPMGWKLVAWLVFCVVWDHVIDRIGSRVQPA
jgi:hypothetical protein